MPVIIKKVARAPARPLQGCPAGDERLHPTQEAIAKRAYELYLQRGGAHGRDWDDWFQAEVQLKQTR
ncbi:MAG: DUF2934 domain-containing protein [Candidatus Omnitrophica bacterium]|nr:DUF2934 domain-containing protein [Candidatus Omnitrophota bacterium]